VLRARRACPSYAIYCGNPADAGSTAANICVAQELEFAHHLQKKGERREKGEKLAENHAAACGFEILGQLRDFSSAVHLERIRATEV
jgi:hypothetical protein